VSLLIGACANNQEGGKAIGAITGAIIGNQFGKGSGKVATTLAGEVVGGIVGNSVAFRCRASTTCHLTIAPGPARSIRTIRHAPFRAKSNQGRNVS
jgi:outer membrane lipoprotein SlyB